MVHALFLVENQNQTKLHSPYMSIHITYSIYVQQVNTFQFVSVFQLCITLSKHDHITEPLTLEFILLDWHVHVSQLTNYLGTLCKSVSSPINTHMHIKGQFCAQGKAQTKHAL